MSKEKPSSRILYKNLVENMNEGVWVGDKNERTVYANPKFCKMVGYDLKEIMGWESYVFWDKASANKVRTVNTTDRKKGISSSYEGILLNRAGGKVPVLLSGASLSNGGTIGIMTDLSELKKKEATEHILANAIERSSEAMIVLDEKLNVILWNRGARLIFGYKKEEQMGKSLEKIFNKVDLTILQELKKEFMQFNAQGIHKSGDLIHLDITLSKERDHLLVVARDITNYKRFEQELSLKYEKLKEAYNHFGIIQRQMDYVFDLIKQYETIETETYFRNYIVISSLMLSKADACVLRVYNESKNSLELAAYAGVPVEWSGKASVPLKGSLAEEAFLKKMPMRILDITQEPRYKSPHLAKGAGLTSLLLLPLSKQGKKVGTLSFYVRSDKKISILENEFLERYCGLVAQLLGA